MRDLEHLLSGTEASVSPDDNRCLMEKFSEEEIFNTLKEMGLNKALGFDGFLALFFKGIGISWGRTSLISA